MSLPGVQSSVCWGLEFIGFRGPWLIVLRASGLEFRYSVAGWAGQALTGQRSSVSIVPVWILPKPGGFLIPRRQLLELQLGDPG